MQAADTWPVVWAFLAMLIALAEGIAIGRPAKEDTMTENWRRWLRGTVVGRLVVWPLWTWLTWHLMLDPAPGFNWVDVMSVLTGIGLAFVLPAWREPDAGEPEVLSLQELHLRPDGVTVARLVRARAKEVQRRMQMELDRMATEPKPGKVTTTIHLHEPADPERSEELRSQLREELDRIDRERRAEEDARRRRRADRYVAMENDLDRITRVPPEFPPEEGGDDGS